MIIPRLHYRPRDLPISEIMDSIQQIGTVDNVLIYLDAKHYDDSIKATLALKKVCLNFGLKLLIQNDISLAAKTNADGVFVNDSDLNYWSARDILGDDVWIGVHASRIEEVADLNDDGLVDFISIGDYESSLVVSNGLIGHGQAQRILDDAKLMGYNIPIIASGGISANNGRKAMSLRPYGLSFSNFKDFESLQSIIKEFPLKG